MFPRHKYTDELTLNDIKDPVGSKKFDGGLFFAVFDRNGVPRFISRRQSVKGHYPDRTANLPQFHDIKLPEYAGHVVGLELIHTGTKKENPESHPLASGILNSLPPRAIETQMINGPIRAVLHDVIKPRIATYGDKIKYLKGLENKVNKPQLFFVPDFAIGKKAIEKLVAQTLQEGHEGVIITSLTKPETENPRLKIKHRSTWNLTVSDIHEAYDKFGKPKKTMGALELKDATGRVVGEVGTGFTQAFRQEVWNNRRKWLGKPVQVTGMPPVRKGMRLKMLVYNGLPDGEIDKID